VPPGTRRSPTIGRTPSVLWCVPFPTNGAWTDQLAVPPAAVQVSGFWLRNWRVPSNYGRVFLQ